MLINDDYLLKCAITGRKLQTKKHEKLGTKTAWEMDGRHKIFTLQGGTHLSPPYQRILFAHILYPFSGTSGMQSRTKLSFFHFARR